MIERITKNLSLKLVALLVGLAMWVFVAGQEIADVDLNVRVSLQNVPQGLIVANQVLRWVNVKVKGPRMLAKRLAEKPLDKKVDLKGLAPGDYVFQVLASDLKLPPGVQVAAIAPANFQVSLARHSRLVLPVRPVLKGKPAKGFEVGKVTFKPDRVTISGVESEVGDMDWVWTRAIQLEGAKESFRRMVPLRVPRGATTRVDHPVVEAHVEITPSSKQH